VLFAVCALFALVLLARIGGARRGQLVGRGPAILFAGAAIFAAVRGAYWPAAGLGAVAVALWFWREAPPAPERRDDPADAEARRILGVGAQATVAEIRSAYRRKMATAHPDRGGSNAEAARLTAARDRLLRKMR